MDKEDVVHKQIEYYSAQKKEWNHAPWYNMDGPRDYHIKWGKSERKRQIYITYTWTLQKRYKSTHLQKEDRLNTVENNKVTKGASKALGEINCLGWAETYCYI